MYRSLFGNSQRRSDTYLVFHDESMPNKRWFLIGLSFIKESDVSTAYELLKKEREKESYFGEIHFSDLPKSFGGKYGSKARVARAWIQLFESGLSNIIHFSCLAVDRQSPAYDHRRFKHDFHEYNRFTAMALKAGIAWHLGRNNLDEVKIKFISDGKYRISRPDKGIVDNFEYYIVYRAVLDSFIQVVKGKEYPDVRVVELKTKNSSEDDLLQFTDLLLGATQMALTACSKRPVKRELGRYVVRWCYDLRNPPWQQQYSLHRKYNLWVFPDRDGKPYNDPELKLSLYEGQNLLFENGDTP